MDLGDCRSERLFGGFCCECFNFYLWVVRFGLVGNCELRAPALSVEALLAVEDSAGLVLAGRKGGDGFGGSNGWLEGSCMLVKDSAVVQSGRIEFQWEILVR
ncbi:hypothetical protein KC19_2G295700 [Ceratodon purpureus]|uniref:Uncharacterized protein n=1 Tax=Ceratodon purpureus TaxID=3225 RepID=A0A8T0J338_CERPU|nr:hypothetical protein KC19_2G295700 [Ceratodon purpureus]